MGPDYILYKFEYKFSIASSALWRALPVPILYAQPISAVRKLLKCHIFDLVFPS